MKGHSKALAFATAVLALPLFAYSQNANAEDSAQVAHEATLMRPANAVLVNSLDAVKDQPGYAVSAKLQGKVSLSDGTELPKGTVLLGKTIADDSQQQGTSKLALRFDQARLKDGTIVPIRATIVGFYAHASDSAGDLVRNDWTADTLEWNQEDAASGAELHSKIGGQNSGVFVSSKKDDIQLKQGSQIQFAIGPGNSGQNGMAAGGQQ